MRGCAASILLALSVVQAVAAARAGERSAPAAPAAVVSGTASLGQRAVKAARLSGGATLDRVAYAVDGAESSHGEDLTMWRPDPDAPQGPMQVSGPAAADVGGGNRFDLTENRAIGRAYLAQLYTRYKNWPDAIAAYNWGMNNVDTWIRAGRPRERLLAGVATYTMRVLHDSGLCYGGQTIQLRGSARFDADPGFRPAMADPFIHSIFARFDTDGGALTRNQRYLCGTVPRSFSVAGPL